MSHQRQIRILVADNHPTVRSSLTTFLNGVEDFNCIGNAENIQEVITTTGDLSPDIILLDFRLTGLQKEGGIRKIKKEAVQAKIIVLVPYIEAAQTQALLGTGASAYFAKTSSPTELVKLIRAVYSQSSHREVDSPQPFTAKTPAPELPHLSAQEENVLMALAQGMDDNAIAQQLDMQPVSVNFYKRRLLLKFNVRRYEDLLSRSQDLGIIP